MFVVCAVQVLLLSAVLAAAIDGCEFTLNGQSYDFSDLASSSDHVLHNSGYSYTINLCRATVHAGECQTRSGMVCQYNSTTSDFVSLITAWEPAPGVPNWSLIDDAAPDKGVVFTQSNGDECFDGVGLDRILQIVFRCVDDLGEGTPRNVSEVLSPTLCRFTIDWPTEYACPGYAPEGPGHHGGDGDDDSISGGWVFIILVVVLVPTYIIVGCFYNHFTHGVNGAEMCPQYAFWKEFPGLVSEGCTYTWHALNGCCSGGQQEVTTYRAV